MECAIRKYVIIDGLYEDPDEVRRVVLESEFGPTRAGTYPGKNTKDSFLNPQIVDFIGKHLGQPVEPTPGSYCGKFRLSQEGDEYEQYIHVDKYPRSGSDWGGVVFLNPNPPAENGTSIWKHKESGLYELHPDENWEENKNKYVLGDGQDESLWELEFFCPGKYNRLFLFPTTVFHSHSPRNNFGTTKETARLVQVLFFSNKYG